MFAIKNYTKNQSSFVEITKDDVGFYALINATEGCRLQEFQVNKTPIIKEIDDFPYAKSYASALLFPFVSRTAKGRFDYRGKQYQLDCNEPGGKNALHGLIYKKAFTFSNSQMLDDQVHLFFDYREIRQPNGFPFNYHVQVVYTFSLDGVELSLKVTNLSDQDFPYTIGWHPYFYIEEKSKASLSFSSKQKVVFDKQLITKSIIDEETPEELRLAEASYDDCFLLDKNKVTLQTNKYSLEISANPLKYLQIYTPPNLPLVAVEPMIGLSNSLNNHIGKQELKAGETCQTTWKVSVITKNHE